MSPVVDDQHVRQRDQQNKPRQRTRSLGKRPSASHQCNQAGERQEMIREQSNGIKGEDVPIIDRHVAGARGESETLRCSSAGARVREDRPRVAVSNVRKDKRRRMKRINRRSMSQNSGETCATSGCNGSVSQDGPLSYGHSREGPEESPPISHRTGHMTTQFITGTDRDYDVGVRMMMKKNKLTGIAGGDKQESAATKRHAMDKKKIATYFDGSTKDSTWSTDLVEPRSGSEMESDPTGDDDCVFVDGPPNSKWRESSLSRSEKRKKTASSGAVSEDFTVTCSTATMTANFSPSALPIEPDGRDMIRDDALKRTFCRSLYMSQFFRFPRFKQMESSGSTTDGYLAGNASDVSAGKGSASHSISSNSNISRQQLNPKAQNSNSIRLSIDKLRFMVQSNLIATLIGTYVLVSLAVIVVLILPYIFDFTHKVAEAPQLSPLIAASGGARTDQSSYPKSGSTSSSESGHETSGLKTRGDKSTQTVSASTQTGPDLMVAATLNITTTEISSLELSQSTIADADADDDGAGVGGEADSDAANDDTPMRVINYTTPKEKGNRFSSLWTIRHNQQCQPMKVPLCSKSLDTILSDSGIPINRQYMQALKSHFPYDKTLLPNQFTRGRQSQISRLLDKYEPIIDIKCNAMMPLFLCSIFAPKCVQEDARQSHGPVVVRATVKNPKSANVDGARPAAAVQSANGGIKAPPLARAVGSAKQAINGSIARLIPPCRSLCKEAFRKCMFFFEVLSLKFLEEEACDSLPDSSDPLVCVGQFESELVLKATGSQNCGEDKFRCTDGECISKKWRCDGFNDCTDKSDEMNCSKCNAKSQFYCGLDVCISKAQVCNGIRDCRDGRDERQCLRLSDGATPSKQQLQAWNALEDTWVPVCGAHWSAMPMSHQACQALGYSRANETIIVYGSSGVARDELGALHKANLSPTSAKTRRTAATNASQIDTGRVRRSPGGWFDVSSGDSYTPGDTARDDDSAQLASMVEDVASGSDSSNKGVSQRPADHMIHYERVGPASGGNRSSASANRQTTDIASIDVAEIKLKSLTSMLYYGPEAGCLGRPGHLVSSVHLQCQNFQCGRAVSSYSTRMWLQQRQAKQSSSSGSRATPALRSLTSFEGDEYSAIDRVPRLEASEELNDERLIEVEVEEENEDKDKDKDEDEKVKVEDSGGGALDEIVAADGKSPGDESMISSRLVVGGVESMPGEFPYLAALHGGPAEVFFCGGVIISINWLLTASHCVGNRTQPDGWMVKVGVTRRIASPALVKKLKVRKIIKHPEFGQGAMFNNDIALILLEESVEYNQYLRPICLPVANLKLGPDNSKDCVVVGFGKSKYAQEANYLHVAHFANVPIVNRAICSNWYAEHGVNLTEGMLCAGYAEGKRDACQGDSGSGLFCRYSNTNQFFVAGVVSFGIKCATPKLPGIYTSVPSYVDWIEQVTRQHGYPLA